MTTTATTNASTYNIDPAHSSVEFIVRHLVISKVRGRFSGVSGTISLAADSDVPTAVDATIDVASIDTRESQRDDHLRSGDFLDATAYPAITFKSTAISGSPSKLSIAGDLTIHGQTKNVVLLATMDGRAKDPWGMERAAFSAELAIKRGDFGLVWNQALEAGGVLVGDEVKIELSIQAVLAA